MKSHDFENDVKRLLFSAPREQKANQLRRRIWESLFAGKHEDLPARVMALAELTERCYLMEPKCEAAARKLLYTMSSELFGRDSLSVILELAPPGRIRTPSFGGTVPSSFGVFTANQVLTRAHQLFMCEFFECAGGTLERSMAFALFLLETFGQSTQRTVATPPNISEQKEWGPGLIAFYLIAQSAIAPPHKSAPQKRWLERLIENASKDPHVEEVFDSTLSVLATGKPDSRFIVQTMSQEEAVAEIRHYASGAGQIDIEELVHSPRLVLSDTHVKIYREWQKETDQKLAEDQQEIVRDLTWFTTHETALDVLNHQRASTIYERPRRGFRPSGCDHIEIAVKALRNIGIRGISFYPEGCTFPNVRVHIIVRKETPHLLVYESAVENFRLLCSEEVFYNSFGGAPEISRKFLEHLIIDVMHRIIVGDQELRQKKNGKDATERHASETDASVPVRPFIRRLPAHAHASEEARSAAEQALGWKLRDGYTFVATHYRGGKLVYNLPTEPFAIYGNDDLPVITPVVTQEEPPLEKLSPFQRAVRAFKRLLAWRRSAP